VGTAIGLKVRNIRGAQPPPAVQKNLNDAQAKASVLHAKPALGEYRRNLPHLQKAGRPLLVTFSTHKRQLVPESVRSLVLKHCLHDHGVKLWMHVTVVMPDHVHLLFTPLSDQQGHPYGQAEIMQGIKGASAHSINKILQRKGRVWQEESFDRELRSDESAQHKAEYICENPVRKGLVENPDDYPWIWHEWGEGSPAGGAQPATPQSRGAQPPSPVLLLILPARLRPSPGCTPWP
jgi:putative transposase